MQLVVAYPNFVSSDAEWITTFRKKYDQDFAGIVEAHYTLVFPTDKDLSRDELRKHVEQHTPPSFETRCRCAQVVDNPFIKKWHVFLVPDEGYSDIVKLHDKLYTGPLEDQLRLDIPFISHIGIATLETAAACKLLADELNSQELDLYAPVRALDVCDFYGKTVVTRTRVELS